MKSAVKQTNKNNAEEFVPCLSGQNYFTNLNDLSRCPLIVKNM